MSQPKQPPYMIFVDIDLAFLESADVSKIPEIGKAICRYAVYEMERQEWFDGYRLDDLQSSIDNIGEENESWYYLNVLRKLESDINFFRYPKMNKCARDLYANIIMILRYCYWSRNGIQPRVLPDFVEWVKFLVGTISRCCRIDPDEVAATVTQICIGGAK